MHKHNVFLTIFIEGGSVVVLPSKKGTKRSAATAAAAGLKDYKIEYAKSGRAGCRGCEQKILKDEVSIFDTF